MSDLAKEFFEFLEWCDTRIFFEKQPSQWLKKDILLTVMIVLRSPTDVLSRIYSDYDTFVAHIRALTINEDPVSHRGLTVTEDHFDKWNAICLETGSEEGMYKPAPRRSRFLKHFMNFMKALGLNTQKNYLLSRDFCTRLELQRMTLEVVLQGNGHLINVLAPNYHEHITSLLPAS